MFITLEYYIILFFSVLTFFMIKKSCRVFFLSLVSILYCFHLDIYAGTVLLGLSLINFGMGRVIHKYIRENHEIKAKRILAISIAGNLGILIFYKYAVMLLELLGATERLSESWIKLLIIPIGFSFYLFQAISYLVDIYRKDYEPCENLWEFLLYMSFFPKLISGPIERPKNFLANVKDLEKVKFWHRGRLSEAFTFFLYGFFLKVVVADRLVKVVDLLFAEPGEYSSLWIFAGMFFYTFQIYADFAGYSYIAIGCAKLFGMKLNVNFKQPYSAETVSEFWKRWHISLSSWLRDYVYIPLGGNRRGQIRKYTNLIIVFFLCGLWHGDGTTFVIWGLLHGIYSIGEQHYMKKIPTAIARKLIVFLEVSIAWVFFRAANLKEAILYFSALLSFQQVPDSMEKLGLKAIELWVIFGNIIVMLLADHWGRKKDMVFPQRLQEKGNGTRYFVFYILIILIILFGIFGPGYDANNFIYMQF